VNLILQPLQFSLLSLNFLNTFHQTIPFPAGAVTFFSSPPCLDWIYSPSSTLSNGYPSLFPLGVKRPESEANHSSPSSAEVKNTCNYKSNPHTSSWRGAQSCIGYVFMTWYLVTQRRNLLMTLFFIKTWFMLAQLIPIWTSSSRKRIFSVILSQALLVFVLPSKFFRDTKLCEILTS